MGRQPFPNFDISGYLWREVGSIAGGIIGTILLPELGRLGTGLGSAIGGFLGSLGDGNTIGDATEYGLVDGVIGTAAGAIGKLLPSVKVLTVAEAEVGGTGTRIIVGETMSRIGPEAGRLSAVPFEIKGPWPGFWPGMWKNFKWLMGHIAARHEVIDLGIDPARAARSQFYRMEKAVLFLFQER